MTVAKLKKLLIKKKIVPKNIRNEDNLLKLGLIDSFTFMNLISVIESYFKITFSNNELSFNNFNSINKINKLINDKK